VSPTTSSIPVGKRSRSGSPDALAEDLRNGSAAWGEVIAKANVKIE
jgi:hypothetical protein